MKNTIVLYILAGAWLLVGISMIIVGLTPPPALQQASSLKRNEFAESSAYDFDALELWTDYGSVSGGDNDENGFYYIAYYEDQDGQIVLFSVYLDNSSAWKAQARACDFSIDTLPVDACFQSKKITVLDDDMEDYYAEAVDYTVDYMREYGRNPIDSGLHLKYVCDDSTDYEDAASMMPVSIVGIVMLLLCAGSFFLARRSQKKARKAELAAQRELEQYSGVSASLREEDYKGPEF